MGPQDMQMAKMRMEQAKNYSPIKIKPSHKGKLHKELGVKQGQPIPASKLTINKTDSPEVKKEKQFAINTKQFKH